MLQDSYQVFFLIRAHKDGPNHSSEYLHHMRALLMTNVQLLLSFLNPWRVLISYAAELPNSEHVQAP